MRTAALDERRPLRDAEAMLLVDDGDREVREVDLLLDERVRAHDDLGVPRRDELARGGVLLRAKRAREERDAHAERRAELVDRQEVLLGERLGRSHQRSLAPGLDRAQERVQRDDGLARPDVALQESLHRNLAVEIRVDLAHRALLVGGERERERLAIPGHELARGAERLRRRDRAGGGVPQERQPEDRELVEREPRAAHLCLRERSRSVNHGERVRAQRKALRREHGRRQVVSDVADELERLGMDVAERLLRDVLRRGVDGRQVAGLGVAVEVVRGHGEAVPIGASADAERRTGHELRLEPRLVEPRGPDLSRLVRDLRGQDLQSTSPAARRRADDDLDDRLLVPEEVTDPLRRRRLLVAPRPLPEDVVDGREPELCQPPGDRRPDSLQGLDRSDQAIRPRRRPRSRPALGRVGAGEPAHGDASDRPHQTRRPL